jgi:DNA-binding Lrp family transcriptional regulator
MIKLDLKDKKIIYYLDLNARQTNSEIAKKVQLSKDAVGYRIKKLEEQGIIRGYNTIVDHARLGYIFYRAMFKLIDVSPEKLKVLINFLTKHPKVGWVSKLDGIWNFGFGIWVKSNQEFRDFYFLEFGKKFKKYVKESQIVPMTKFKHYERSYLIGKDKNPKNEIIEGGEKEKYDETDVKILKILTKNAKTSLLEIAEKLKVNSMTIHHRIKRLEKIGIINGYRVNLNFNILKKDFYSVKVNMNNLERLEDFEKYVQKLPATIGIIETVGGYDFDFDIEVDNLEEYYNLIEDLKEKFNFIREISYFRNLLNYKVIYMPEV